MMKRLLVLILFSAFAVGCGGTIPSPKASHAAIEKYFKKYGKKYKQSDFGQHPLEKVEIEDTQELQKDTAEVLSRIHLKDGVTYYTRVTLQKKSLRWKVMSWENLAGR